MEKKKSTRGCSDFYTVKIIFDLQNRIFENTDLFSDLMGFYFRGKNNLFVYEETECRLRELNLIELNIRLTKKIY